MSRIAAPIALAVALVACRSEASPMPGGAPAIVVSSDGEAAGVRFLERLTGGASASEPLPLIVAIHAYAGRPERMANALSSVSVCARIVCPYGPETAEEGFSWFPMVDPARVADAADRLAAMISAVVRQRPTVGKPIVTGFSQGAILSYALAVLHPEVVRAAFPMSGGLPQPLWPGEWPVGKEMPLLHAFHGDADATMSIEGDRAIVERLARLGFTAELSVYPGEGHAVSAETRRDLVRAVESVLVR